MSGTLGFILHPSKERKEKMRVGGGRVKKASVTQPSPNTVGAIQLPSQITQNEQLRSHLYEKVNRNKEGETDLRKKECKSTGRIIRKKLSSLNHRSRQSDPAAEGLNQRKKRVNSAVSRHRKKPEKIVEDKKNLKNGLRGEFGK